MKTTSISRIGRSSIKHLGLAVAAGAILAISSASAQITWNLAGSGAWDTSTANWSADGGATTTTFTSDGTVDVNFNTSSNATITISAGMDPASTTANPSGGTLQFSGGPIAGSGGLTKSGNGVLRLNGENSFTGKTVILGGRLELWSSALLSDAGANGGLGAPTGSDAIIDIYNGATLKIRQGGGSTQSTDRTINFADPAGAGTVTIQFNGNDCSYTLGAVTATGNGAKLLDFYTGVDGNGDRATHKINGPISDVTGDSSPLSLRVAYRTQTTQDSFFNLPGVNTFTGDIETTKGSGALRTGYFTVGGERTNGGSTPGTGALGSGNYPGNIAVGAQTVFNYLSSASQTLSGVISGVGEVIVDGGGTVTLSGLNTHSGNITVESGSTLVLANGGGVTFSPDNSTSNKITGDGTATLDGAFTIDTSNITAPTGSWTLVDVAAPTYGGTFSMAGAGWSETSDVWTRVDGISTWTFTEATGVLTLTSDAVFTSFSYAGIDGVIDNDAFTVTLFVASGTNFADVAPTYTVTSGSCDQPNGGVPTPSFGTSNPVTYTVTDGGTVNPYAVTVVEASDIINVSFERFTGGGVPAPAENLLEGPAGGLGTRWNQYADEDSTGTVIDSVGAPSSVTFATNFTEGRGGNGANQPVFHASLTDFGRKQNRTLTIAGLTPSDLYDVWIIAYRDSTSSVERLGGYWSTPNTTTSPTGDRLLSSVDDRNGATFVEGVNYLLYENVEADGSGIIVFNGRGGAATDPDFTADVRLGLSGIQLAPASGSTSAYSTWASTNAPTTGNDPAGDEDGDTVSNELEFVLGGTISTNDLDKLPTVDEDGTNMTFTFERDQDSVDGSTVVTIEVGTDLVTWPDVYTVGADTGSSTAGVTVTDNLDGTDTIVLTVPMAPDAKKFARLKVVVTP